MRKNPQPTLAGLVFNAALLGCSLMILPPALMDAASEGASTGALFLKGLLYFGLMAAVTWRSWGSYKVLQKDLAANQAQVAQGRGEACPPSA